MAPQISRTLNRSAAPNVTLSDPFVWRCQYMAAALALNRHVLLRESTHQPDGDVPATPVGDAGTTTSQNNAADSDRKPPTVAKTPAERFDDLVKSLRRSTKSRAFAASLLDLAISAGVCAAVAEGLQTSQARLHLANILGRKTVDDDENAARTTVEEFARSAEPRLLSAAAAYNGACALIVLYDPDPKVVTPPSHELERLLKRAVLEPGRASYARRDPFFTPYLESEWFQRLAPATQDDELGSLAMTRPFASALTGMKVSTIEGVRARVKTAFERELLAHLLGDSVTVERLTEWDTLLALVTAAPEGVGVPRNWLDALDQLGVRSVESLARQNSASLHAGLAGIGKSATVPVNPPETSEIAKWITQAKALSQPAAHEAAPPAGG